MTFAGLPIFAAEPDTIYWSARSGFMTTNDVFADTSGFSYTVATYGVDSSRGMYVTKYDPWGRVDWTRNYATTGTPLWAKGNRLTVDSQGNVYVVGSTFERISTSQVGPPRSFIVKYDSLGNQQWLTTLSSTVAHTGDSIQVDSAGHVFVAGTTQQALSGPLSGGTNDGYVSRLDATTGNVDWIKQYGEGADLISNIKIDGSGQIYFTGLRNDGQFTTSKVWASKLDSSGATIWNKTFGIPSGNEYGSSITLDATGGIYIAGSTSTSGFGTPLGENDAFVLKLDQSGNQIWSRIAGSFDNDGFSTIIVGTDGNPYAMGGLAGNVLLQKYAPDGALLKSSTFGDSGKLDSGIGLASNPRGEIFVTGHTYSSEFLAPRINSEDGFVFKLAPAPIPSLVAGFKYVHSLDTIPGVSDATTYLQIPAASNISAKSGKVLFTATLKGANVTTSNDSAYLGIVDGNYRLLARESDPASGIVGAQLRTPTVVLNEKGRITMISDLVVGPGGVTTTNNSALWAYENDAFQVLLRKGDAAPGTLGLFGAVTNTDLADGGRFIVNAGLLGLAGSGIDGTNNRGVWLKKGLSSSLDLIARAGQPVVAVEPDILYTTFELVKVKNDGNALFNAKLRHATLTLNTNRDSVLMLRDTTSTRVIARENESVPNAPGYLWGELLSLSSSTTGTNYLFNSVGDVAFLSNLTITNPGSSVAAQGLFIQRGDQDPKPIVLTGSVIALDSKSLIFSGITSMTSVNTQGQVAFRALTSAGDGLWQSDGVTLRPIVAQEFPFPDGKTLSAIGNYAQNEISHVALNIRYQTGGATTSRNDSALSFWDATAIRTLFAEGDLAPDVGGAIFDDFGTSTFVLNNDDRIAFTAELLSGAFATLESNDFGLWVQDPSSQFRLVLREGDSYRVGDNDTRTVSNIALLGRFGIDAYSSESLDVRLGFSDGSSGIFSLALPIAIPEPGTICILISIAGTGSLILKRRNRFKIS